MVAFTACVFHHSDIGGRVASDNHDVFEEGLFIPFVKLYDRGVLNQSVLDLIRWNVRTPDEVTGDIRSQISANYVCAEKVGQMLKESGLENLDDLADQIIRLTEKSMREEIEKIPDGIYRAKGLIEQTKGNEDILIQAQVEIKGSDILVDLDGSSGQVNWGGNVVFNFTYAYVFMAIKSMFAPDIPNNDGCARPIQLTAPEGTVVNCRFPAAVAARMGVGHFMTEVIYRALSEVLPRKVIAGSGGTPAAMNVFYGRRKDGKPWHSVIIRGGGMGAGAANDGNYVYIFPANGANTRSMPVPSGVDAAEAVSLVLNYVTAYQMLHRSAKVRPGQRALRLGDRLRLRCRRHTPQELIGSRLTGDLCSATISPFSRFHIPPNGLISFKNFPTRCNGEGELVRLRTLIFDDNPGARQALRLVCERRGYEVFTFPDPPLCPLHVMDRCRCPAGVTCTDIIIADLNMPQIHGLDFFETLFAKRCVAPYLALMSGAWSEPDEARALRLGCWLFTKPFTFGQIDTWFATVESLVPPDRQLLTLGAPEWQSQPTASSSSL